MALTQGDFFAGDSHHTMSEAGMATGEASAPDLARQRFEAYRGRRRRGAVLVAIELKWHDVAALERLALL